MESAGQVYFLTTEAPEQTVEDVERYKQAIADELLGRSVATDTTQHADELMRVAHACDDCGDSVIEPGQGSTCGSCVAERG